ncbi:hypothetical protein [Microbacterium sp. G2-8]|uniref:hypothetical protein n=1 Tax=Microbacterium sp. G2-8 TaxID=2842454 RepID=UPI001C8965A3|nr:hypothetical protein [Microbacterium sp. G2-8]
MTQSEAQRTETFAFMHRENFLGRSGGAGMQRWDYRGYRWEAIRPADGEPPMHVTASCTECDTVAELQVLPPGGLRRQRALMLAFSLLGVLVLVAGLVMAGIAIPIADDSALPDAQRDDATAVAVTGVIMVMVGLTVAWTFFLKREAQIGVTGRGAGAAGLAKHVVTRVDDGPAPE